MSGYSEDDIRRAADIREWLIKQIEEKQEEVERLRTTLSIIDSLLKQGSFKAAASIGFVAAGAVTAQVQATRQAQPALSKQQPAPTLKSTDNRDIRPLKRAKDDFWLANAEVSPTAVVLVPAPGVNLNSNTPPFKSFFLNRILEGMKNKDASQGIKESDGLNYKVEEENGAIKRIAINNYRDRDRLQEIFNTSTWVFTRMLEKSG
ncbi:MAG TPA: hypothetical protein VD736_06530 [Nitrososphaera sp.]|nr:hypothetical protein [Nitrososphaera sp.]